MTMLHTSEAPAFHAWPLLEVSQDHDRYYTLMLSQKRIALYRGNRKEMKLVAAFEAAYGESDVALAAPGDIELGRSQPGRDVPAKFRPMETVSKFVALTEPYISNLLLRETSSLILVGSPLMHRLYRKVNTYPYLAGGNR